jgi:CHAT domain-containing protein
MGGEALVDAEATGERLRREAPGRAYLHIAAHAALRPESPNSSFVELADGPFHTSDALTLDLRSCRLVTLSACRTGLGRQSGGDEQIGLLRAFRLAGADAVLATLWRVDDSSTSTFMRHVYRQIADGALPQDALRCAQLAFICGADEPPRRHPYFWAGFQLVLHRGPTDAPPLIAVGERSVGGASEVRPG